MNHEAKALKALKRRLSQLSSGTHSIIEIELIKQGIEAMEADIREMGLIDQAIEADIYDIYGINQLYEKLFK